MTPKEQEYFEELLDSKFSHLETKIEDLSKQNKAILLQTTQTNGRVTLLELWKARINGVWYAVTIGGVIVGFIIGAAVEWYRG